MRATATYLALVIVTAATIAFAWLSGGPPTSDVPGTTSTLRSVDVPRIQRLIQEGRLSDREARHWRPVPGPEEPQ